MKKKKEEMTEQDLFFELVETLAKVQEVVGSLLYMQEKMAKINRLVLDITSEVGSKK